MDLAYKHKSVRSEIQIVRKQSNVAKDTELKLDATVHNMVQTDLVINGLSLFWIPSTRGSGSFIEYSSNLFGQER